MVGLISVLVLRLRCGFVLVCWLVDGYGLLLCLLCLVAVAWFVTVGLGWVVQCVWMCLLIMFAECLGVAFLVLWLGCLVCGSVIALAWALCRFRWFFVGFAVVC